MKIGRQIQLECPRCRQIATRRPGRQTSCTHCGAELVVARSPSEEWIRAYLYGSDGEGLQVRPLDEKRTAV
jgi:uncharacterized paraquat-inducible protein A